MKKFLGTILFAVALIMISLPLAAQSNVRYDTNYVGFNTKVCWENTSNSGIDICLRRAAAGTVSIEKADGTLPAVQLAGLGGIAFTLGDYQGTTSVGITDTNFHALAAAASDIAIPANYVAAKKRFHVRGSGIYTNAAASLLNAEVMLCKVSGCGSGTIVEPAGCAVVTTNQANNLTNGQFTIDCVLTATATVGASGTFMAKSKVCATLGTATSAVLSCFADTATAVSATVDETAVQYVNIGFKFSTSNAGNSAILHEYSVEAVN